MQEYPLFNTGFFKKIGAKRNRGMGIWRQRHRDVPRLRAREDDQGLPPILRQRRWVGGIPREADSEGSAAGEEVQVGSGVLKVQGAFWDTLEGSRRRPQA